jgi:hypothetical protein
MADRPLLVFPEPEHASRTKLPSGRSGYHYPSFDRQGNRLSGVFDQLQSTFNERAIELQQDVVGLDPEQVLVLEIIGTVDDFMKAVQRIEGFEWMAEIDIEGLEPDEDFYIEGKPEKSLNGRLYLIMSNQRALSEMLSLWRSYVNNPNLSFQWGLSKFKNVFHLLKDIRRWSVQDRLEDTGVIDYWKEIIEIAPDELVSFETELWYRNSSEKRTENEQFIVDTVAELGGQIVASCQLEGIKYHAILTKLPSRVISDMLVSTENELLKHDSVMFFRPVGQIISGLPEENLEVEETTNTAEFIPTEDPILALLDGLPMSNHVLLKNHIIIDDPDNWSESYEVQERIHGTAMASLIVNGDLNNDRDPITSRIYVRPIMKPNRDDFETPNREYVPNDVLVVDLVHSAVTRLFEGQEPAAPSIKIINLSIGDPSRHFNMMMSPLGRLIDWLAVKYNILFIISSGNHANSIALNISKDDFAIINVDETKSQIVKEILSDIRNRRLLSPAESINALTIGALHNDDSEIRNLGDRIDPFQSLLPSPISSIGGGYRRSIKPDIIMNGGRQFFRHKAGSENPILLDPVITRQSPGIKVAVADKDGSLSKTRFTCGTSNAAALVSHASVKCYKSLDEVLVSQLDLSEYEPYLPVILKAAVVHGAHWGEVGDNLREILDRDGTNDEVKSWISRWIGNGVPDFDRILDCTPWRATIIGFGELNDEGAHIFRMPLPDGFSSVRGFRRITITLAWFSPVLANTQKYRNASLWFEVNEELLNCRRKERDWQAVRRGTLQHEIFDGEIASPYSPNDTLNIKVNCRKDAGNILEPVKYGLLVSFEISDEIEVNVYEEIRTKLITPIQIEQRI